MKVVKRIKPNSSHHMEIFFHFYSIYNLMMDAHWTYCDNYFMTNVNQIFMLYILNLYSAVGQLYFNTIGRKSSRPQRAPSAFCNVRTQQWKDSLHEPESGASPDTNLIASLSWTFQPPDWWEVKVCCLNPPVYGIFVLAAQTDEDRHVYYLDCGGDFMAICMCQIHQNLYIKYAWFLICQLYCNKAVF